MEKEVKPRKNIQVATLDKVRLFLDKQKSPVYKSDIVKGAKVDFHSIGIAIKMLEVKIDSKGRIKLK